MFGLLPIVRPNFNQFTTTFNFSSSPRCYLLRGGGNTWHPVKERLYYGLTDDGHFIVYVPQGVDVEAFGTDNELYLLWCAFESLNQPYFNLGKENTWYQYSTGGK